MSRKATLCLSISMLLFCSGLYSVMLQLPNYAQKKGFSAMQSAMFLSIIGVWNLNLRWAHTHFVGFVMSRLIWNDHNELIDHKEPVYWST